MTFSILFLGSEPVMSIATPDKRKTSPNFVISVIPAKYIRERYGLFSKA